MGADKLQDWLGKDLSELTESDDLDLVAEYNITKNQMVKLSAKLKLTSAVLKQETQALFACEASDADSTARYVGS